MILTNVGVADGAAARIAETFNRAFGRLDIRLEPDDVQVGSLRRIQAHGWLITYRVIADDAGSPSLEYYATHRMTGDRHVRIWADGHAEELDAIYEAYGYKADEPGSKEAAEEEYLRHNKEVAEYLRQVGLYPDGDINAYLRTGGDEEDDLDTR
jgi:hypothetical protein